MATVADTPLVPADRFFGQVGRLHTKEELEGEAKKIQKKLRQINFLEKKLESGEIVSTPEIRTKLTQARMLQETIAAIESKLHSLMIA